MCVVENKSKVTKKITNPIPHTVLIPDTTQESVPLRQYVSFIHVLPSNVLLTINHDLACSVLEFVGLFAGIVPTLKKTSTLERLGLPCKNFTVEFWHLFYIASQQ